MVEDDVVTGSGFAQQPILLVEDSEDDVVIMQTVFRKIGLLNPLQVVRDGEEAITYLQRADRFSDQNQFPVPAVILLDLNMPKRNGFEVLGWLRGEAKWIGLPVHVLSTSRRVADVERAYALGATAYLVKPGKVQELAEMFTKWQAFMAMQVTLRPQAVHS